MTRLTLLVAALLVVSHGAAAQEARPVQPVAPVPSVAAVAAQPLAAPNALDRVTTQHGTERIAAVTAELRTVIQDRARQITTLSGASNYDRGLNALQQHQYDRAVTSFDRVIAAKAAHADGALYWKAYAQSRLGRWDDARGTLSILKRDFAQSRYLADARVLEADLAKSAGQPIDQHALDANDEIRLYAISGIANTDPDRAIPLLESVLGESNALGLKKRAIYVLALSTDPRAHAILLRYAKGAGNPDLQIEAIRYLASRRDANTPGAELKDIYHSTADKDVRRAIIDAYRGGSVWPVPLDIHLTGGAGGVTTMRSTPMALTRVDARGRRTVANGDRADELWSLYAEETDADLRGQMTNVFATMGAADRLTQIAKSDASADVRGRAIRSLGRVNGTAAAAVTDTLLAMYDTERDATTRRAVIDALAGQQNAAGLVALARKETDLALKTAIVRHLSDLAHDNKTAADYLMEVIPATK